MPGAAGRSRFHRVDGVLLLDKPAGISSNAALQRARRALGAARAGHAGTLDPMATGLLVVCFGEATKFAQIPTDADKAYDAEVTLGQTTTTGDTEGEVLDTLPVRCDAAAVQVAAAALTGEIEQVPPMYSALKLRGRAYYEYARAGETIDRQPRRVRIAECTPVEIRLPSIRLRIACSKGTYVRTLAEQLGERLGCGGHLSALRRTRVGGFDVADAVPLAALEAMPEQSRPARLLAVEALVAGLAQVSVDGDAARQLGQGRPVATAASAGMVAMFGPGMRLLGLGEVEGSLLHPRRMVLPEAAPPASGAGGH